MTATRSPLTRRAFLWTAVVSGLAALGGEWWARRQVSAPPRAAPFAIPGTSELAVGAAAAFAIPATATAGIVVRTDRETYTAFDQRCPHLGCPVQWSAARARFECPCHAAIFDGVSGRVLAGPPRRGLRRIALQQRGDQVWALPTADDDEDSGAGGAA